LSCLQIGDVGLADLARGGLSPVWGRGHPGPGAINLILRSRSGSRLHLSSHIRSPHSPHWYRRTLLPRLVSRIMCVRRGNAAQVGQCRRQSCLCGSSSGFFSSVMMSDSFVKRIAFWRTNISCRLLRLQSALFRKTIVWFRHIDKGNGNEHQGYATKGGRVELSPTPICISPWSEVMTERPIP